MTEPHSVGSLTAPRVLGVVAAAGAAALGAGWSLVAAGRQWHALRGLPSATVEPSQLLGILAELVAALLLGWLALSAVVAVVACRPNALGRSAARLSTRVSPALVRSVVAAALGGSIVIGSTAGAIAAPTGANGPPASVVSAQPVLPDPGWTPQPPPAPPSTRPGDVSLVSAAAGAGRAVEDHVVVRRGDTLWAIAERHLGRRADPAQIAREWPRWYAANRQVIGDDPDRLQPGQLLRPPHGAASTGNHR